MYLHTAQTNVIRPWGVVRPRGVVKPRGVVRTYLAALVTKYTSLNC